MPDTQERIAALFREHIETAQRSFETLLEPVAAAGERLSRALARGGKILACGNGGSACDAQHFTAELVNRFERERFALAALALTVDAAVLTAVANDNRFDDVFARQIQALGRPGDVLLAISTSGTSPNIVEAVVAAHEQEMAVVALTGRDGGALAVALRPGDVEVRVPSKSTARIQELHALVVHCLCDRLERGVGRTESVR